MRLWHGVYTEIYIYVISYGIMPNETICRSLCHGILKGKIGWNRILSAELKMLI